MAVIFVPTNESNIILPDFVSFCRTVCINFTGFSSGRSMDRLPGAPLFLLNKVLWDVKLGISVVRFLIGAKYGVNGAENV